MGFIGAPVIERAADGATFGHWIVNRCGADVPKHGHTDAHFMWAISGWYETSADLNSGRDDDVLVYNPPGTFHGDRFLSGGGFFVLNIEPALGAHEVRTLPSEPRCMDSQALRAVLRRLGRESVNWDADSGETAQALCLEAISIAANEDAERAQPRWLIAACERLREEKTAPVATLAGDAGVHPTHFIRSFRRHLRCTPGEYARAFRLEAAKRSLSQGGMSIAEAAQAHGFSDQSHLTRRFREAYGVTPGEYCAAIGAFVR